MLADLDPLLTAVFCPADDLLPEGKGNARRRLTDAEVVALCVAQSIMGVTSDACFAKIAARAPLTVLGEEGHAGARTLRGLRVRIATRLPALAAALSLNHEPGRPSRALVDCVA